MARVAVLPHPMKLRVTPLLSAFVALVLSSVVSAATPAPSPAQQERVEAAYVLALGRTPTAAELAQDAQTQTLSVPDLVARLARQLKADAALQRATRLKAFVDAYGRAPRAGELEATAADASTYTELMQRHVAALGAQPDAYRPVLDRAYQLVVRRGVYDEEVAYWKARDTLSFVLLVGCIEDWARRNQPGLMVTAGTPTVSVNSTYLTTLRLSPAIAEEARAVVGLARANTDYFRYGSSRTVIAAGAGDLVSGGRIHFVAAGSANLSPARTES